MTNDARMHVLQMIEDGRVSAAEGLRLLEALSGGGTTGEVPPEIAEAGGAPAPDFGHWQRLWVIPASIGVVITVVGAFLMFLAYRSGGLGLWLACAAIPMLFGVAVLALGVATRTAKWVHLRVKTRQEDWPRNIALSFPLPLRLTAWCLKVFGPFIPQLKNTGVDELLLALGDGLSSQAPLFVDVTEGENGERVQVYVG